MMFLKLSLVKFSAFQRLLYGFALFGVMTNYEVITEDKRGRILIVLAWWLIISGWLRIPKRIIFGGMYKYVYVLYWFLLFVMLLRGYGAEYSYWTSSGKFFYDHIMSATFILPYFLPLLLLIKVDKIELATLINANILLSTLFLIFFLLTIGTIIDTAFTLLYYGGNNWENPASAVTNIYALSAFVIFCKQFISERLFWYNLLCLVLCIVAVGIAARRGSMAVYCAMFIFSFLLYVKTEKKYVSVFIVIWVAISFFPFQQWNLFDYLVERGFDDTRSGVDEALLSQMSPLQMWIGKGLLGRYYLPMIGTEATGGFRYITETGFIYLILRGGYLFLFCYIWLLAYPALKGLFSSNNSFVKVCSAYIGLSIIEMYPWGWPVFDLKYFLIWICALLCLSKHIRNMTDDEIVRTLFKGTKML